MGGFLEPNEIVVATGVGLMSSVHSIIIIIFVVVVPTMMGFQASIIYIHVCVYIRTRVLVVMDGYHHGTRFSGSREHFKRGGRLHGNYGNGLVAVRWRCSRNRVAMQRSLINSTMVRWYERRKAGSAGQLTVKGNRIPPLLSRQVDFQVVLSDSKRTIARPR